MVSDWDHDVPPARGRDASIGFGHRPDGEHHHFVVSIPRSPTGQVQFFEVFEADLVGPQLDARNLRVTLDMPRWLKIADAVADEFNPRLRLAGLRVGRWKVGPNPVARLFGKELVLLAWAIEDADPTLSYAAVQNWRGLAPEERWWLYTMTAAQSAHHSHHNKGWRKAIRFALTENPIVPSSTEPTSAERRMRARVLTRGKDAPDQGKLLMLAQPNS